MDRSKIIQRQHFEGRIRRDARIFLERLDGGKPDNYFITINEQNGAQYHQQCHECSSAKIIMTFFNVHNRTGLYVQKFVLVY